MTEDGATARRIRVERNIYRRASGVYEVGFKDGGGKQRWRTVAGGITAARALRDELLARRGRGERVVTDGRLRSAEAAAKWLDGPVLDLRRAAPLVGLGRSSCAASRHQRVRRQVDPADTLQ